MSEFKAVPMEPTAEMVEAAEEAYMPFGDMDLALRMAILAAPVVQVEPSLVAWVLYDATADQKYIKMASDESLAIFDSEAAARRAKFLHPGTDYKRCEYYTAPEPAPEPAPSWHNPTFRPGDHVRKTKGSQWKGRVVGTYSTTLTPEGYAVESDTEKGSVQIYPVGALELVVEDVQQPAPDVSALVGALESILHGSPLDGWGNRDDDGISSAISMGIQRDSLQRWRKIARQALDAHRKGAKP